MRIYRSLTMIEDFDFNKSQTDKFVKQISIVLKFRKF